MRKLSSIFLVLFLLTLPILSGCETKHENNNSNSSNKEYKKSITTITDFSGKKINLNSEINKISCSLPALENMILLLGEKDKLASAMPFEKNNYWVKKIFPDIEKLPTVFTTPVEGNIEELLRINPDIVLVGEKELRDKIQDDGLNSAFMTFTNADEMMKTISDLGTILGKNASDKAEKLNELYKRNIDLVKERTRDIKNENRPRVYYSANGLLNTEGANTIIDDWMTNSGCVNVAAENGIKDSFKDISPEELISWNPDIIILRDYKTLEEIERDDRFNNIKAVKNDRVIVSPKGVFTWTTGSGIILQNLFQAKLNYPDLFKDIDIKEETRNFYKKFYEYNLSDDEIDLILNPGKTELIN